MNAQEKLHEAARLYTRAQQALHDGVARWRHFQKLRNAAKIKLEDAAIKFAIERGYKWENDR